MRSLLAAVFLATTLVARAEAPQAPSGPSEEVLGEWPRAVEIGTGTLEIYQPQLEKFEGVTLTGRSAVSWTEKDQAPAFGVLWFTATASVDRDSRTATVESLRVDKVRFPNVTKDQERKIASILEAEVPRWNLTTSVDAIQASLAVTRAERRSSEGLRATPPRMLFSNDPAVLLLYAGKPVEQPIPGTELTRVANTPMFVVHDPATRRYYLSGGRFWYEAASATGPFTPVAGPSPAVKSYRDANPPPAPAAGDAALQAEEKAVEEPATPPRILVSTEPAELYVFDGPPRYVPVGDDADLLYAENTQRDVLVYVPAGDTYVLASGRWFRARSLAGPWTAVRPDQLPAPFASLPPDSPVGNVRTFVSGTEEARDALADTQIPQTTVVRRDQSFEVVYDGEPRFKAIEGTPLAFAVNTPFSVVRDAGSYWACDQGVWYVASTPKGPWAVSDRRPPDIDQVPPSAPVYNTKYVYVYQSAPEVVTVGYLPGYVGMYPYYGTVVYGTGFYYPPYIGPTVYYARPWTYGFGVAFDPWIGFGFTMGFASPFYAVGAYYGGYPYYRPGWWGPPGYRPYPPPYPGGWYRPPPGYRPPVPAWGYRPPPPGYRPPPGGYPGARPPPPGYRPGSGPGWNNSLYARPYNRARNADRAQVAASRPAPRPVGGPNNVYADRKGNVYRQTDKGGWERNTPQGWRPQPTPSSSRPSSGRPSTDLPQTRPAPQPSTSRPAQAQPQRPTTRPAPQQQAARPSSRPAPSWSNAPAGLGRDAAARQRSTQSVQRSGGGTAPRGGGAPRPAGGQQGGGHGGGRGH